MFFASQVVSRISEPSTVVHPPVTSQTITAQGCGLWPMVRRTIWGKTVKHWALPKHRLTVDGEDKLIGVPFLKMNTWCTHCCRVLACPSETQLKQCHQEPSTSLNIAPDSLHVFSKDSIDSKWQGNKFQQGIPKSWTQARKIMRQITAEFGNTQMLDGAKLPTYIYPIHWPKCR